MTKRPGTEIRAMTFCDECAGSGCAACNGVGRREIWLPIRDLADLVLLDLPLQEEWHDVDRDAKEDPA